MKWDSMKFPLVVKDVTGGQKKVQKKVLNRILKKLISGAVKTSLYSSKGTPKVPKNVKPLMIHSKIKRVRGATINPNMNAIVIFTISLLKRLMIFNLL